MGHEYQDRVSLEMARRIAAGLSAHPEWVALARANLDRWSDRNRHAPGLLRCYDEWRSLLDLPIEEIRGVLLSPTDEGTRLRHNSPFVGILTPAEVWEIKRRCRNETIGA